MCEPADRTYPPTASAPSLVRADALEREITELCAHINAANHRLLTLLAELDAQQPWGAWGLDSCAHWLNWRCGISLNAAREKLRVAHALTSLPAIDAAFASGELSYSKVRALTRVAAADTEDYLLELARHATAAQVENLVRGYRRAGRAEEAGIAMTQYAARELHYYTDDDGSLVIRARLPADEGALVVKAIEAVVDAQAEQARAERAGQAPAEEDERAPGSATDDVSAETPASENRFARRRADALTVMAETTLRHGPKSLRSAQRYQVVVHVSAETLRGDAAGRSALDGGPRLAPDSARRLACDGSLLRITGDAHGNPLDVGRKTRAVPPAMRRALRARDGGCRFPGCTRRRFVDAHHIEHWADGGVTAVDNLVLLCRHHHRLVHEGGFGLARVDGGGLRFARPDGRLIEPAPTAPIRGSIGRLCRGNAAAGHVVDAADRVVAGDSLDYGIAVEGLLRKRQPEPESDPY